MIAQFEPGDEPESKAMRAIESALNQSKCGAIGSEIGGER
jgi:hypothetical protein